MSRSAARIISAALTLFLAVTALGASPARAAQSSAVLPSVSTRSPGWMYDPSVVVDINLQIADITQVSCDAWAPRPYVPATFTLSYTQTVRGKTSVTSFGPWQIGVHAKGWYGSFRCLENDKAGLKLKFSSSSQRINGIKKITLNNMVQDGSMSHEALSYEVFRSMDIAAPRTGYARLTVNGVYKGMYLNIETYDDVSLARWFPKTTHLYEGSYGGFYDWTTVADAYGPHYEVDEGDELNRTNLQTLLNTAQNTSSGWYARMAPIANLEQMTQVWALEAYLGHWDGYSQFITNNYYLHVDGNGVFTMHPWGMDQSLNWANLYDGSPQHFIFNGCVTDPICSSMYTDALLAANKKVKSLRLDRRADQIALIVGAECGCDSSGSKGYIAGQISAFDSYATTFPASPRTLSVSNSRGSTRVSWSAPLVTTGITEYAVEYRDTQNRSAATPWTRVSVSATATSITLSALRASTYEFRVRSVIDREHTSLPFKRTGVRIR
jgi:hypothetical protein